MEVAEYTAAKTIVSAPNFSQWFHYCLMKRNCIIAVVNSRIQKRTHKYGVEVPTTVRETYSLCNNNWNEYRRKAIIKEMNNVSIVFTILEEGEWTPPIQSYMPCHMIFGVSTEFTRKSRYVATGWYTPNYDDIHYAGIVSHDIFRIEFTYTALNGIDIMAADIQNDYLTAP